MNKVFHINLGGYPFTIDEDAYAHLSQYLETIHQHFKSSEGYEDITSDIESRLAELFQESLAGRTIVVVKDVKDAITIMGTPEEFGAAPLEDEVPHTNTASDNGKKPLFEGFKPGKRLFRDKENKVVGGVCAGIATYMGIQDPLWVRIFFIIMVPVWGFTIPLYIILLIILPEAKTAADRLAMRGEPINVSSIAKTIEEGVESISRTINDIGNDLSGDGKKKGKAAGINMQGSLHKAIAFIGELFGGVLNFISKIFRPLFFIIGILSILSLLGVWIGMATGGAFMLHMRHYFTPDAPATAFLAYVNVFFLTGVPLVSLILVMLRIFFRQSVKGYVHAGMWTFWTINLISLVFIGAWFGRQFSTSASTTERLSLSSFRTDTLNIVLDDNAYENIHFNMFNTRVTDEFLVNENVRLHIEKSDTKDWQLIQQNESQGRTYREASSLASQIAYKVSEKDGVLHLSRNFLVNSGTKFRGQSVVVTLKVPEGKFVRVGEYVNEILSDAQKSSKEHFSWGLAPNYPWRMDADGLTCIGCPAEEVHDNEGMQSEELPLSNFSELNIQGPIAVYIEQGDFFKVRVNKPQEGDHKLTSSLNGQKLSVTLAEGDASEIYITMPVLKSLQLENTGSVKVTGFRENELSVGCTGDSDVKLEIDADALTLNLEGTGNTKIVGKGRYLKANLDKDASLEAQQYDCKVADIFAFGDSQAEVSVSDTLRQKTEDEGNIIKVFGNPVMIKNQ